mgnify:CR=1 FL=1
MQVHYYFDVNIILWDIMIRMLFRQQNGCFRTNCVDCLDRTNAVQTYIALMVSTVPLFPANRITEASPLNKATFFVESWDNCHLLNMDRLQTITS